MYLLGAAAKITWVIEATATPPVLADLDVLLINPEGTEVYLNSPIAAGDYTAPTDTIDGSASYTLTPDIEGLWKILLVIGTASSYTQLSKVEMQVLDNATTTNPVAVYLKTQVTSEAIKVPCEVATTVNITLSGLQTIDLLAVAEADRVLVKDQTDTTENGLYNASSGAWIRTVDFDQDAEITNGVMVLDNNAGVMYGIRFTGSMDVGVTEIAFAELAITDSPLAEILNNVEYAEEWAIKPEDTLVSAAAGGDQVDDYSAMHFSIKAADDATLASGHAVDADTARGLAVVAQGLSEDAQAASELAEDGAEAVYQVFDDRYLGDHATNPTTLNDLVTALDVSHDGIEFWDSTLKVRKVFNGSTLTWGLTSTSVATNAVDVNLADAGGLYTAVEVESALQEVANTATATLENKDLTDPLINGIPTYGMVLLDDPIALVSTDSPSAAVVHQGHATLTAAQAKKAILHVIMQAENLAPGSDYWRLAVHKDSPATGSFSTSIKARLNTGIETGDSSDTSFEMTVNLDANYEFAYANLETIGYTYLYIYLVGYYV